VAFIIDHGADIEYHGLYNLLIFAFFTVPILSIFACLQRLAARSGTGWRRVGLVALAAGCILVPMNIMFRRRLYRQWTSGLNGLQLHSSSPLHRSLAAGGDSPPAPVSKHPFLAAFAESHRYQWAGPWQGCEWPIDQISFPLMDLTPAGAYSFWMGRWWQCPGATVPDFQASARLAWDEDQIARMASAKGCDPASEVADVESMGSPERRSRKRFVPALLDLTCPLADPSTGEINQLSISIAPDLSGLAADVRGNFNKEQQFILAAMEGSVWTVDMASRTSKLSAPKPLTPDPPKEGGDKATPRPTGIRADVSVVSSDPDAASVTVQIGSATYGEAFVIRCGPKDQATLLINRPDLAIVARLQSRWGSTQPAESNLVDGKRHSKSIAAAGGALPSSSKPKPPNVIFIMLDAVARPHFERKLPKTVQMLESLQLPLVSGGESEFHMFDFLRYHSVAFNTHRNTMPFYTGRDFEQPGNEPLWEYFTREAGYASAYVRGMCEDWSSLYAGYASYPDYDMSAHACLPPVYPLDSPFSAINGPYSMRRRCIDDRTMIHTRNLEYGESFWHAHRDFPKYLHMVFLEGHEGSGDVLGLIDDDLSGFLHRVLVKKQGAANTILVVASDHGLHMGLPFIGTAQGAIEHMRATLLFGLPLRIQCPNAEAAAAFGEPTDEDKNMFIRKSELAMVAKNQHSLTTPWDGFLTLTAFAKRATVCFPPSLYKTADVAASPGTEVQPLGVCAVPDFRVRTERNNTAYAEMFGHRLFDAIPAEQDCAAARIDLDLCQCRRWYD
jgi:hypothetical protein